MVLQTYDVSGFSSVKVQPLTPESFAKFGDIISADHQIGTKEQSSANYGTAIKVHKVSQIINNFDKTPSKTPATANWNIFRCSPPNHLISTNDDGTKTYLSKVLERHPFSSQTFLPIGVDKAENSYVVICAESRAEDSLPDPKTLEAFICHGNQAVTYRAGTWHAPMVSLKDGLDFGVMIHENGVPDEDCQECYFEPGFSVIISQKESSKL